MSVVNGSILFFKVGIEDIVNLSVLELLRLTVVEVLNGAVVTCDTAVNLGIVTAIGTVVFLTRNITVVATYGICG